MRKQIRDKLETGSIIAMGIAILGLAMLCTILYYGSIIAAGTWIVKSILGW